MKTCENCKHWIPMKELEGKCVLYGLKHCAWTPSEATCDEWVSDESEVDDKTDLISRADAIEAIFKVGHEHVEEKVIPLGAVTDYSDAIKALPSAETTGALDDAIAKYVADGLMELPSAEAVQEWIPCSERLPIEDGRYLVCMDWEYDNMEVLRWADGWNCYRGYDGKISRESEIDGADIIAWMPLPKPYRAERRE